jgi:prophage regulatory protein
MESTSSSRLIRLPEVKQRTGLSVPQLYRLMAENQFPRSVALGANTRGWVKSEVDDWIQARIDARDLGTDADLRVINPNIGRGRSRRQQQEAA